MSLPAKITFVAGTLGQGGAERQLFYILKALRENAVAVRILCLTRGEFWEERIRELGVPVAWVGQSPSRFGRLRQIISELRKEKPDVLQSQHFYTNLYVTLAARALGLREVGAVRNDVFSEVADGGRLLGRLSLQAPRTLAANSRLAIQNAISLGVPDARCFWLPNVVDTDRFQPAAHRGAGPVRVLAVGRLVEQKRFDRLIRVLAQLKTSTPVQAAIAGAGPLEAELKKLAADAGLGPERLEFKGAVADLAPVYRESDIFVLTSDHEGTPNVVLEAMASGLPVVTTRVGGVPEIVEQGRSGFVVEPDDEESFTSALRNLIESPDLRMKTGALARAQVEANQSLSRLPRYLEDLYRLARA